MKAAAGQRRTRIVLCARGARAALRASRVSEVCVARSGQSRRPCLALASSSPPGPAVLRGLGTLRSCLCSCGLETPACRSSRRGACFAAQVLNTLTDTHCRLAFALQDLPGFGMQVLGTLPGSLRFSGPQASPVRSYKKVSLAKSTQTTHKRIGCHGRALHQRYTATA